jgi:hypothetical protein
VVVESEPDALHMDTTIPVVLTPAIDVDIAVTAQAPEVQEGRVDTTVIPEAEPDLPSHEIKTEGSSSIKEGDVVQDSAAAEPGPEVVAAVLAPVFGTLELQAQNSVEETTEVSFIFHSFSRISLVNFNKIIKEVHIVEASNETECIVPDEGRLGSSIEIFPTDSQLESTVEPVKAQLEIPEAGESDHTAEVEPQIVMEELPAEIEEDRPVLATLQVRQLLSSSYLLTVEP